MIDNLILYNKNMRDHHSYHLHFLMIILKTIVVFLLIYHLVNMIILKILGVFLLAHIDINSKINQIFQKFQVPQAVLEMDNNIL